MILGAGISGLTAGRLLLDKGHSVQILDKGRGVGGRVATRWKGTRDHIEGRWDHGAQFATFRSRDLISALKAWEAWDVLQDWLPSHSDNTLMRMCPAEGMNAFAKALAAPLDIQRSERVCHLERSGEKWTARTESGHSFEAPHVISTLPMPQLLDLAEASGWALQEDEQELLQQVTYERCLSLLAETAEPVSIGDAGYARVNTGVLETVISHRQKGISDAPTFTAHATPSFSLEWYDRDRPTAASVMRAALQEILDTSILSVQIHGWKFAKAIRRIPHPFVQLSNGCILAGDGFEAGDESVPADLHPRIESAMLSGLLAARKVDT